jgi:hypothetical protein
MIFCGFDVIMSGACSRLEGLKVFALNRTAHQRVVAWLALAAMALIVLMPVMSRSMPMSEMPGASMAGMQMDPDCPMAMDHAGHHQHGAPCNPDDPTARCGYCVVLTHTPVVGFGPALVLVPQYLPALAPQAVSQRVEPSVALLSARPRGPPSRAIG